MNWKWHFQLNLNWSSSLNERKDNDADDDDDDDDDENDDKWLSSSLSFIYFCWKNQKNLFRKIFVFFHRRRLEIFFALIKSFVVFSLYYIWWWQSFNQIKFWFAFVENIKPSFTTPKKDYPYQIDKWLVMIFEKKKLSTQNHEIAT